MHSRILVGLFLGIFGILATSSQGQEAIASTMFPFVMPDQVPAASLVNISHWNEKPAGKHGFVQVRNGHFWQGNQRIRFWGTNLAFGGNFPDKAEAVVLADKLARLGVNVVRLHSYDATDGRPSVIKSGMGNTQIIDTVKLDQMDFLVAELIKRGIYINMNLHVNRDFLPGDGVDDTEESSLYAKMLSLFDPRMLRLHQKFAAQMLSHLNPYTKNRYSSEPGLAFVEITNENSFFYGGYSGKLDKIAAPYAKLLDQKFNAWLKHRHGSQEAIQKVWGAELAAAESIDAGTIKRPAFDVKLADTPRKRDYLQFLWDTEFAYFQAMRDFLKTNLQVKMPITGTMEFTLAGAMIQGQLMDFTDMHAYWQHPEFATAWKGKWTIGNTPLVDKPLGNTLTWLASMRIKGKPYSVSEFNEPWPNFYDAEALPLVAAYGARQDWDAIYIFNFNGDGDFNRDKVMSMFDIDGHPVKTAQLIAGAALFRRGDMPVAGHEQTGHVSQAAGLQLAGKFSWSQGEPSLASLGWKTTSNVNTRWSLQFTGGNAKPTLTENGTRLQTPETEWPLRWNKGLAIANTSRTVMMVGRPTGTPVIAGDVSINMQPGAFKFGTVSLHSMDSVAGKTLSESDRVLVLACGRTANTGMKWDADFKSSHGGMGSAPVLTEGVAAEITMKTASTKNYKLFALNESGVAVMEVPITRKGEQISFTIDPKYKTIWYMLASAK